MRLAIRKYAGARSVPNSIKNTWLVFGSTARSATIAREEIPVATGPSVRHYGTASQGQTATLDLQLDRGVSAIASYVAMTRLRKLEDLLLFRGFDREAFCDRPLGAPCFC